MLACGTLAGGSLVSDTPAFVIAGRNAFGGVDNTEEEMDRRQSQLSAGPRFSGLSVQGSFRVLVECYNSVFRNFMNILRVWALELCR